MFELKSGKVKGAPNVLYMGVDHIHGNSITELAQWGRFSENVKKVVFIGAWYHFTITYRTLFFYFC